MNCMSIVENSDDFCKFCGHSISEPQPRPFLPLGTILEERYLVGKGIEMNGEGLSYIGYDKTKKSKIYIREFFPQNLCGRKSDSIRVMCLENKKRSFDNLLTEFLRCFRSVAKVRNLPSITAVYDIFNENGTAYIVMEWIDGVRLEKYLAKIGGTMHWNDANLMFMPLLSSIIKMENFGIRHLGICPTNMLVTSDNRIKLIGFATKSLRSAHSEIEGQLYDGCSALEQYGESYEASEATDVYGFMASLFLALTGEYPLSALKRVNDDRLLISENILENIPDNVISSLANALKISQFNRTLSFESVRIELSNSPVFQIKGTGEDFDADFEFDHEAAREIKEEKSSRKWGIIACVVALTVLLAGLGIYLFLLGNIGTIQSDSSTIGNTEEITYQVDDTSNAESEKIAVPNLVGRNYANLKEEISNSSLNYQVVLLSVDFSDDFGEGCIISQTPTAGEEISAGSTIAVNVSKGPQKQVVPDVTGKTLSEASQAITNAKLVPVQTSEYNDDYAQGIVMGYKNCEEGDLLDYGTEVIIIVSKGKK